MDVPRRSLRFVPEKSDDILISLQNDQFNLNAEVCDISETGLRVHVRGMGTHLQDMIEQLVRGIIEFKKIDLNLEYEGKIVRVDSVEYKGETVEEIALEFNTAFIFPLEIYELSLLT